MSSGSQVDQEVGVLSPDTSISKRAFTAHRPTFHLIPVRNWLNDPCAPCIAKDGTYQVFFQYTAEVNDWHKIQWGYAESKNLLDWKVQKDSVLIPNENGPEGSETPYDREGVFTGCMMSVPKGTTKRLTGREGTAGETDDTELMIAYTSVSAKPDEPYPPNCETLSLAFPCPGSPESSHLTDWEKYSKNPILPSAPSDKVIAWRDPYAREWETLDQVRGKEPGEVFYGIIAGGYKGIGSALFLYEIDKQKVEEWTYLGDFGSKSSCWRGKPLDRWGADMRDIFEVANFVTLSATVQNAGGSGTTREEKRDFFLMSAATWASEDSTKFTPPQRPPRQEIFVSGDFAKCSKETVLFRPEVTGYIDRGGYYAMNTFCDPTRAAVVAHAWVMEDDLSHDKRHEQGWSGFLALPRTIKLEAISSVLGCLGDKLEEISSVELLPGATKDTHTVLALHVAPCEDVIDALKDRAEQKQSWDGDAVERENETPSRKTLALGAVPSHTAILQTKFQVKEDEAGPLVIRLRHNEDLSIHTSIILDTASGTITIDRSKSVSSNEARYCDTRPEVVPHVLFYCQDEYGKSILEPLEVTVVLDHGVIEMFVNGRTAITTRIYTGHEEGCDHMSLQVGQHGVSSVELWHGLSCTLDYV